jgi:hypothetical protein
MLTSFHGAGADSLVKASATTAAEIGCSAPSN